MADSRWHPANPFLSDRRGNSCAACSLHAAILCHGLGDAVRPTLRHVRRNAVLAAQGETPAFAGVLRRGFLRVEHVSHDGRRSVLAIQGPGELVGNWTGAAGAHALEAATDAEICAYDPRALVRHLARDSSLRVPILQELDSMHQRQLDLLWSRGALTTRQRIVAFIIYAMRIMPSRINPDGSALLRIVISRRDWADMCGTTVETICRTLGELSQANVVRQTGRGCYWIRDLNVLVGRAGIGDKSGRKATPWQKR